MEMRGKWSLMLAAAALTVAVSVAAGAKKHDPVPPPPVNTAVSVYRANGVGGGQMLFLRESPDKDSDKVGAIPADGRCARAVGSPSGEWVQVSYRGVTGYARIEHLSADNPGYCSSSANLESCSRKGGKSFRTKNVSPNDVLWIHDQPAKTGNKIGAIPADGSCIQLQGMNGEWWQVSYHGVTGWVNSAFLQRD
jgi:hypothetical protein